MLRWLVLLAAVSAARAQAGPAVFKLAVDVADAFINSQRHKEVMGKLDSIRSELDEVKAEEDVINEELQAVYAEVKLLDIKIDLQELNQAKIAIMAAFDQLQRNAGPDSRLSDLDDDAARMLQIDSDIMKARENYYEAMVGTLPSQQLDGKTLVQKVFDDTGLLPVHLMQSLVRTQAIAQSLISWSFLQRGDVTGRNNDKQDWNRKYAAAWTTNDKLVFAIADCRWGVNLTLECTTAPRLAAKRFNGTLRHMAGHNDCRTPAGAQSIPTRGTDNPQWSFDLSCDDGVFGLSGGSNCPSGIHHVNYVAGFRLHCSDHDTDYTSHFVHDSDEKGFDVSLGEQILSASGCVNFPHGHSITYWAAANFVGVSGNKGSVQSSSDPQCNDGDSVRYGFSCEKGFCMQRFQGFSDVPSHHSVSYIACLNIYCALCIDAP